METNRLIIKKLELTDCNKAYDLLMTPFVREYNMIPDWDYTSFLKAMVKHEEYDWYIYKKDTSKIIGGITLEPDRIRFGVNSWTLSYWLGEKYIKQGYMIEALDTFIQSMHEEGINVFTARVFSENIASHQLMKKLGFVEEGYLKNAVRDFNGKVHDDVLYVKIIEEVGKNI